MLTLIAARRPLQSCSRKRRVNSGLDLVPAVLSHLVEVRLSFGQRSEQCESGKNVGFADLLGTGITKGFDNLLDEERRGASRDERGKNEADGERQLVKDSLRERSVLSAFLEGKKTTH